MLVTKKGGLVGGQSLHNFSAQIAFATPSQFDDQRMKIVKLFTMNQGLQSPFDQILLSRSKGNAGIF